MIELFDALDVLIGCQEVGHLLRCHDPKFHLLVHRSDFLGHFPQLTVSIVSLLALFRKGNSFFAPFQLDSFKIRITGAGVTLFHYRPLRCF